MDVAEIQQAMVACKSRAAGASDHGVVSPDLVGPQDCLQASGSADEPKTENNEKNVKEVKPLQTVWSSGVHKSDDDLAIADLIKQQASTYKNEE